MCWNSQQIKPFPNVPHVIIAPFKWTLFVTSLRQMIDLATFPPPPRDCDDNVNHKCFARSVPDHKPLTPFLPCVCLSFNCQSTAFDQSSKNLFRNVFWILFYLFHEIRYPTSIFHKALQISSQFLREKYIEPKNVLIHSFF